MKNNSSFGLKPLTKAVSLALAVSAFNVQAAEDANDEGADEERIVITGSKIRRDEMNDTVPVEVILASEAVDRGITSVGQLLRESTLASGSAQVTAATSTAFVQNGGIGAETISLRGLGAGRTLVLLNGRRAGPAGIRGSIAAFDFNTIPLSAVDRIEILKDGASSLYGSDAVAGVINIITRESDGGTVEAFTSQPSDGGGEQSRISASWGQTNDSSSFRVTLDYDKRSELKQGQRDYFSCGERYYFDADTNERIDILDPRTGNPHCSDLAWGHVWLYDYGASNLTDEWGNRVGLAQFDYDGDLGNYIDPPNPDPLNPFDFSAPPGWFVVNGVSPVLNADHPFQDLTSLIPESTRATFMATGDIEFSDSLEGYAELILNRRETKSQGYRQFWSYIYNENFFAGNPLSAGWTGAQWLSPTAITDHSGSDVTVDYTRVVAGLEGEIGEWYWDASIQHSRSDAEYTTKLIYNDAITDQNWLSGSCVGMTTSVNGVDCIDIPWLDPQFLAGNISPEMREFLFGTETGTTEYTQTTIEGVVSGELFEMPAGYVAGAFGFQYQEDDQTDTPGEQTRLGNGWGSSSAGITTGKYDTSAVFAEFEVPVADNLNLTASARYTDNSVAGDDLTYKLGAAWKITDTLSLRGSKGTSFRSPKIYELFLNDETSFVGQRAIDPCIRWQENLDDGAITQRTADNCAADGIAGDYIGGAISATVLTGGGAGILEAETSDSQTWGLVWRPEFADLNVSIDYFDYLIEGEVTQLGAGVILSRCYDSEFFATDPLCDLFDRDALDQRILTVSDSFINIAKQTNKGYDFKLEYTTELPFGELYFRTEHTIQEESRRGLFADTVQDFNGTIGEPKHTGNYQLSFTKDNWSATWFTNFIGKGDNSEFNREFIDFDPRNEGLPDDNARRVVRTGGVAYHTVSFGYNHEESGISAVVGVRNLTDKIPPRLSRGGGSRAGNSALYSQYDFIGRSYFLNLKYEF